MKLFSSGAFYMHHSPRLAAEWLNDADTVRMSRDSGILLSTVVQYQVCATDTRLWRPEYALLAECSDVAMWLGMSCHNVAWMLDYFTSLHDKSKRLFRDDTSILTFIGAVKQFLCAFDDCDASDDYLLLSPSEARVEYRASVKKFQYRKVKLPYWFDTSVRESAETVEADANTFDLLTFDPDEF